jgi:sigma-B regulation protein RsbU (phosphoserine phosphatase)
MAVTRTLFRSTAGKAGTPGEILAGLNMEIYRDNESCMFVTLFCGIRQADKNLLSINKKTQKS